MIKLSEKSVFHIIELMMDQDISPDTHFLRVSVIGSGCAGLSYKMEFDDEINETDEVFNNEIKVVCDKKSLLYLWGTELNYSDGLNGKGFEWKNPNSTRVCGCGSSFGI